MTSPTCPICRGEMKRRCNFKDRTAPDFFGCTGYPVCNGTRAIDPGTDEPYTFDDPRCLDCGAIMLLRKPKPGALWDPFWGCSDFPGCRGTRPADPETCEPIYTPEEQERMSLAWVGVQIR